MSDNEHNEVALSVSPATTIPAPVVERVVVSILKVHQATKSPKATAATKKSISFPPDDLLAVTYITYSADEYFRGRVRLPERRKLVTYVPDSEETVGDDDTQQARHESRDINIDQTMHTNPVNDEVGHTSNNAGVPDTSVAAGVDACGDGNPAQADEAAGKEQPAGKKHIPAFHREIGLEEVQYASFTDILRADPSTSTTRTQWSMSDDFGTDDGRLGGF